MERRNAGLTRREWMLQAGALALAAGVPARAVGAGIPEPGAERVLEPRRAGFRSRPDLEPPLPEVFGHGAAPGFVFYGPRATWNTQPGPLIVDRGGQLVWFRALQSPAWVTNVGVQSYLGSPVLAWWEGQIRAPGYGEGEAVILDRSYRELARVRAARGFSMDLHELQLTPQGTALFTCHPRTVEADLSSVGGPRRGHVLESVIQEVDVRTGRLLFEWRGLDHVALPESELPLSEPWDYLHVNSIDVLPDGNLLISARNTWTLYKLDRRTGQIIWRLGGKRSDFSLGRRAQFQWQHDARQLSDGTVTLFDDNAETTDIGQSRALALSVDVSRFEARVSQAYEHRRRLLSGAMGSAQALAGGHVLVGWGSEAWVSEFAADGSLVADLRFPDSAPSYRARRDHWSAVPAERPAATVDPGSGQIFASWNGATDVAHWELRIGPRPSDLRPVGRARTRGFETPIRLPHTTGYAAVAPVDRSGRHLVSSRPVRL